MNYFFSNNNKLNSIITLIKFDIIVFLAHESCFSLTNELLLNFSEFFFSKRSSTIILILFN